jgi:hypothetical protein
VYGAGMLDKGGDCRGRVDCDDPEPVDFRIGEAVIVLGSTLIFSIS